MAKSVTKYQDLMMKIMKWGKQEFIARKPRMLEWKRAAFIELAPPSIKEFPEIGSRIGQIIHSAKTGAYRELTVKEAWLNCLVAFEVTMWFFVGECIGKRHLIGYEV